MRLRRGQLRTIPRSILLAATTLLVWWCFTTLFAVHKPTALHGLFETCNGLWNHAVYLVLFFIVITIPVDERRRARLLRGFVFAMLPAALYCILQHFRLDLVPPPYERPSATMGNPVILAALFSLAAPFALGFIVTTPVILRKIGWTLVFAVFAVAIYFTRSRGPWIGFGLATTGLVLWIGKRKGLNAKSLLGALVVLGLVLAALLVMRPEKTNNLDGDDWRSSGSGRFIYYKAAAAMIGDHPVTGIGFDNFRILYPQFRPSEDPGEIGPDYLPVAVHDGYLQVALTTGVPGLVLYLNLLAMVLVAVIAACRRERQIEGWIFGAAIVAAIGSYLIQDLSGWPNIALESSFWLITALAVTYSNQESRELKLPRVSLVIVQCVAGGVILLLGWLVVDACNRFNADQLLYRCSTNLRVDDDWPMIESTINRALRIQPADAYCEDKAAQIYLKRLSVTKDAKDYDRGIGLVEQAHLHNPYDVYILIHGLDMATLAMKRGLIKTPSGFVEQAAGTLPAMDKYNPSVYEAAAKLKFAEEKFDEFFPMIRHAQALVPFRSKYYLLEAAVYQRLQDPKRADACLKTVMFVNDERYVPGTDEWVLGKHAVAITFMQEHDYVQAQKILEEILQRYPADVDSHLWLGDIFLRTGKPGPAREMFVFAQRVEPSNRSAKMGLKLANDLLTQ